MRPIRKRRIAFYPRFRAVSRLIYFDDAARIKTATTLNGIAKTDRFPL
jgi:hypothetical protein